MIKQSCCAVFLLLSFSSLTSNAASLQVAVASNFLSTLELLAHQFHQISPHRIKISSGSTGRLFTSIRHGAPYDIFLAADEQSIQRLTQQGLIVADSVRPYARGELVVYLHESQRAEEFWQKLASGSYKKIALANAQLAPYGRAAEQFLQKHLPNSRIQRVVGANIAQAYLFVYSGSVPVGLVARSQVGSEVGSKLITIAEEDYEPIIQLAGILTQSKQQQAAREFMQFLASDSAQGIIIAQGYKVRF